jgi:hypothetical protein
VWTASRPRRKGVNALMLHNSGAGEWTGGNAANTLT